MKQCMVSTSDNPYNPFDEFDKWYEFDRSKGYHSLSYLARVSHTSPDLSEIDYHEEIEDAIDDMVRLGGLISASGEEVSYIKVTKEFDAEPDLV